MKRGIMSLEHGLGIRDLIKKEVIKPDTSLLERVCDKFVTLGHSGRSRAVRKRSVQTGSSTIGVPPRRQEWVGYLYPLNGSP